MCLGLFYNIKAVWHKYQSMPNISNVFDLFLNLNCIQCTLLPTPLLSDPRSYMSYYLAKFTKTAKLLALNELWPKLDWTDMIHKWMTCILLCRSP